MSRVLLLTGTCGSGKTTVATLLAVSAGWERISEDDLWAAHFGKNRGAFGSSEHRQKRHGIQAEVVAKARLAVASGKPVVIDVTVHECPPEAFLEYVARFQVHDLPWSLRVLHPRLEVAIDRDSSRSTWHLGADRVASLRAKFTGTVFPRSWFLDTSDESPLETMQRFTSGAA